jgi:UvrD-like helicase C-terminal domain/Nuclease-related domain/PhoH-like protein
MAKMIPPTFSSNTPIGEIEFFKKLRDDPGCDGWVALHSLDLKRHLTKIEGELDMVILVPDQGILCLELKGCDVKRVDGKWIYPYETSIEGPFKQASKGMHSLRKYLVDKDPIFQSALFFSTVIFTRIDFDEKSPEWHPWQFILNIFKQARSYLTKLGKVAGWYDNEKSKLSKIQIDRAVNLLRKNFEYVVSPRHDIDSLEGSIKNFTEEQYGILDSLIGNKRLLISGPAGTGKTFLAIEFVRRQLSEGKRVGFFCYNTLLADWIKSEMAFEINLYSKSLVCGTFHSYLVGLGQEGVNLGRTDNYWSELLPQKALEKILGYENFKSQFDVLVLDEAQDLIFNENYLDVMDVSLNSGLAGGSWVFFGDFERQAIYADINSNSRELILAALEARAPSLSQYSLRNNCRNAESIAETLTLTAGITPGYSKILNDNESGVVDPRFYSSAEIQEGLVKKRLNELLKHFKPSEIVILSPKSDEKSCAQSVALKFPELKISPYKFSQPENIKFTSIHAFKGMEAPAILLTDIDSLESDTYKALLYVGMSRARISLTIFFSEICRSQYDKLLDLGLRKTSKA